MHANITKAIVVATGMLAAAPHPAAAATETIIYSFLDPKKGEYPGPLLMTSTGNLVGTAGGGVGKYGAGTFFRLHPPTAGMTAWTHELLYKFSPSVGDEPEGSSIHRHNLYYGIDKSGGGNNASGTLYPMSPLGIETTLYTFEYGGPVGSVPLGLNADSHGNFYGVTQFGGPSNLGTIFKYSTSGVMSAVISLPKLQGNTGFNGDLLVEKNGDIYGTAYGGPKPGLGFVYKVSHGKFRILYKFEGHADGSYPFGRLVEDASGYLYGTGEGGGAYGRGVVYRLTKTGSEEPLYSFTGGADGGSPESGVVADAAGNLYGTASGGAISNYGTVFKLAPDGTETTLHQFTGGADGEQPETPLVLGPSGVLYGATYHGGTANLGVIFQITQ